jgi:hypothetical protein
MGVVFCSAEFFEELIVGIGGLRVALSTEKREVFMLRGSD